MAILSQHDFQNVSDRIHLRVRRLGRVGFREKEPLRVYQVLGNMSSLGIRIAMLLFTLYASPQKKKILWHGDLGLRFERRFERRLRTTIFCSGNHDGRENFWFQFL